MPGPLARPGARGPRASDSGLASAAAAEYIMPAAATFWASLSSDFSVQQLPEPSNFHHHHYPDSLPLETACRRRPGDESRAVSARPTLVPKQKMASKNLLSWTFTKLEKPEF